MLAMALQVGCATAKINSFVKNPFADWLSSADRWTQPESKRHQRHLPAALVSRPSKASDGVFQHNFVPFTSLLSATDRRHLCIHGQMQRILFRETVVQLLPESQCFGQGTALVFDCLQLRSRGPLIG